MNTERLEDWRVEIDLINTKIVELLAKRMGVCSEIAEYKFKYNINMMQPKRIEEVLNKTKSIAVKKSLNPNYVEAVFRVIINETCNVEDKLIKEMKENR